MDLQTLQAQLKTAIQNHQIVVCKMRNDPQNPVLQKQLHDMQAEIMTLSEKQKQVVQQLRKELEKKQQVVIVSNSGQTTVFSSPVLHSSLTQRSNQSMAVHPLVSQSTPVQTQPVALTTKQMTIVQSAPQNIRHVVPSNLVTASTNIAIKAPIATAVLLPHCTSTTNALLTSRSSNHQRTQPVLVVPSPTSRPNDGSHTGVMLNLAPPIRVPQYPPPGSRSVLTVPTACCSVTTTTTTCTTTTPASSAASHTAVQRSSPAATHLIMKTASPHNKVINKEKQIKSDFMSSLGLVTKEVLTELRSRKVERKRRTTANPQFSNAAIEEKKRNAAFLNAENMLSPPTKRPRGRPRLVPQTPKINRLPSPDNDVKVSVMPTAVPLTVGNVSVITAVNAAPTTITITTTCAATPSNSGENGVVNGYHLPQQSLGQIPVKSEPQELCTVCKQKGDLLKCSVCAGLFHSNCLQPPVTIVPTSAMWTCVKCSQSEIKPRVTTWSSSLSVVHSYTALKAAKEEEKKKLLKRSLELKSERTQLQDRMKQLNEVINEQAQRRTELQATHHIIQKSVECLQDFIRKIKQVS